VGNGGGIATFTTRISTSIHLADGRPSLEEDTMIKIMIDAVLFSCMGAFIAGIVAGGAMFISY